MNIFKNKNGLYLVLFLMGLFVLIHVGLIYHSARPTSFSKFVMPSFVDDDFYYYARVNQIVHGNYLIGNPYFYEHQKDISPAFFLPDLIYAVPALWLGSINNSIFLNILAVSLLFGFLTYKILKGFRVNEGIGFLGTLFIFLSFYLLMFRPVSSQVSLIAYAFFLWRFFNWLGLQSTKNSVWLLVSTVLAIYMYPYLAQVVVATLLFLSLYLLAVKDNERLKKILKIGSVTILLLLPLFYYSHLQMSSPFYWPTLYRVGLVDTHLITPKSVYYSLLVLLLIGLSKYAAKKSNPTDVTAIQAKFIFLSGVPLILVLLGNLITGKELEIASHVGGLFALYWLFIIFIVIGNRFLMDIKLAPGEKILLSLPLVLIFSLALWPRFWASTHFVYGTLENPDYVQNVQKYDGLRQWFNKRNKGGNGFVVWSYNESISDYLPTLTQGYDLFNPNGGLQLVSNEELLERYLVASYPQTVSMDSLKRDFRKYLGAGAIHRFNDYNKKVFVCKILHLNIIGFSCGDRKRDPTDLLPSQYFKNAVNRYTTDIIPHIGYYLAKYHVAYFVQDKDVSSILPPIKMDKVYDENGLIVYLIRLPL